MKLSKEDRNRRARVYNKRWRARNPDAARQWLLKNPNYSSDYYRDNKARIRAVADRNRRALMHIWLQEQAEKTGCSECGTHEVGTWCWHHRDPDTKLFALSKAPNLQALKKEMKKCDPMHIGCHSRLHRRLEREAKKTIIHAQWVLNAPQGALAGL